MVTADVMEIGLEYKVLPEPLFTGSLPLVVYQIDAPAAAESVTVEPLATAPPAGLAVGLSTVCMVVSFSQAVNTNPADITNVIKTKDFKTFFIILFSLSRSFPPSNLFEEILSPDFIKNIRVNTRFC